MVISQKTFGGLLPRVDPTLLEDSAATVAHNCRLRSGKLAPLKQSASFMDYPVRLENGLTDMKDAHTLFLWKRGVRKEFLAWPGHVTTAPSNIFDDDRYRIFVAGDTGIGGTGVTIPPAPVMAPDGMILKHKFVQVFVGNYGAGECSSMSAEYKYMDGLSSVHGHILFAAVASPPAGSTSRKIYKVESVVGSTVTAITQIGTWEQDIVTGSFPAFTVNFDRFLDDEPVTLTIKAPGSTNIAPVKDASQTAPAPVATDYTQNYFVQTYIDAYGRESACSPLSNYVTYEDKATPLFETKATQIDTVPTGIEHRKVYKVIGVYGDKIYATTAAAPAPLWISDLVGDGFGDLDIPLDSSKETERLTRYFSEQFANQPCVYVSAIDNGGFDRHSICLEQLPKCEVARVGGNITDLTSARYTFFFQTWVDKYGYESACSEASAEVIYNDGDAMTVPAITTIPDAAAKRRVYKVVTGTETESIQFMWEEDVTNDEFSGGTFAVKDEDAGEIFTNMTMCPKDLCWIVGLPGNFYAGFATSKKRQIVFSEIDIPTSYPDRYRYDIREDAVGLAVSGTTLFVLTVGQPYAISGTDPKAMTVSQIASNQGCVSKRSICTMNNAVFYASQDGVCVLSEGSQAETVLTKNQFSKAQWEALNPSSCLMVAHDAALHMFFELADGTRAAYMLDLIDGAPVLTTHEDVASAVFADVESDGLYMIKEVSP